MICPWDGWEAASVSFCEARLCATVVEPSNAWSSMAYVLLGGWLLVRPEARRNWLLGSVAVANVMIGLGSFAFHATGTFVGELIDLFGMFLLSGLMLAWALGLVTIAFTIWVTDTARLLCWPDNHLVTGHAIWHVLNAVAISRLFFFYAASAPLPEGNAVVQHAGLGA